MSSTDATREARSKSYPLPQQAEQLVEVPMGTGLDLDRHRETMVPG